MIHLYCRSGGKCMHAGSSALPGLEDTGKTEMVPLVEYLELRVAFLPQPLLKHTVYKPQNRQCLQKDLCKTI